MWRHLLTVMLTAALGSFAAVLILSALLGGTGATDPVRFLVSFSLVTMFFSLPGAAMLLGLKAMLLDRGLSKTVTSLFVPSTGAVVGFSILAVISGHHIQNAAMGALFGTMTGLALLAVEGFWAARTRPRAKSARVWITAGLGLLLVATLLNLPI